MDDGDGLDAMILVGLQPLRDAVGTNRRPPIAGITIVSRPSRSAIFRQSVENHPVSAISTASPGDSVLTSAASQAPVPEAG